VDYIKMQRTKNTPSKGVFCSLQAYFFLFPPARFFLTGLAFLIASRFAVFLEREVLFFPTPVNLFAML